MAYDGPMDGNFETGRWRSHVLAQWKNFSTTSISLFYPKNSPKDFFMMSVLFFPLEISSFIALGVDKVIFIYENLGTTVFFINNI